MTIKIEHGKYYVTDKGWIVGPAREVKYPWPYAWALYNSEGRFFEIEGVTPEQAFDTEIVKEVEKEMDPYTDRIKDALDIDLEGKSVDEAITTLAERLATLEKIVVYNTREDVGGHKAFKVPSELIQDPEVVKIIHNASEKINK